MIPRGIRNNNPLNIRTSATRWQGKRTPSTDPAFEQFDTMTLGVRAAFRILYTYVNRYQVRSIEGIISRWAPDTENNTARYIATVANALALPRSADVSLRDKSRVCALVYFMAHVENGQYIPFNIVSDAYDLAFPDYI